MRLLFSLQETGWPTTTASHLVQWTWIMISITTEGTARWTAMELGGITVASIQIWTDGISIPQHEIFRDLSGCHGEEAIIQWKKQQWK